MEIEHRVKLGGNRGFVCLLGTLPDDANVHYVQLIDDKPLRGTLRAAEVAESLRYPRYLFVPRQWKKIYQSMLQYDKPVDEPAMKDHWTFDLEKTRKQMTHLAVGARMSLKRQERQRQTVPNPNDNPILLPPPTNSPGKGHRRVFLAVSESTKGQFIDWYEEKQTTPYQQGLPLSAFRRGPLYVPVQGRIAGIRLFKEAPADNRSRNVLEKLGDGYHAACGFGDSIEAVDIYGLPPKLGAERELLARCFVGYFDGDKSDAECIRQLQSASKQANPSPGSDFAADYDPKFLAYDREVHAKLVAYKGMYQPRFPSGDSLPADVEFCPCYTERGWMPWLHFFATVFKDALPPQVEMDEISDNLVRLACIDLGISVRTYTQIWRGEALYQAVFAATAMTVLTRVISFAEDTGPDSFTKPWQFSRLDHVQADCEDLAALHVYLWRLFTSSKSKLCAPLATFLRGYTPCPLLVTATTAEYTKRSTTENNTLHMQTVLMIRADLADRELKITTPIMLEAMINYEPCRNAYQKCTWFRNEQKMARVLERSNVITEPTKLRDPGRSGFKDVLRLYVPETGDEYAVTRVEVTRALYPDEASFMADPISDNRRLYHLARATPAQIELACNYVARTAHLTNFHLANADSSHSPKDSDCRDRETGQVALVLHNPKLTPELARSWLPSDENVTVRNAVTAPPLAILTGLAVTPLEVELLS